MSRLPNIGLEALEAESTPGRCLACDALLPPYTGVGRKRVICDDVQCRRVYHRAYRVGRSRREGRRERLEAPSRALDGRTGVNPGPVASDGR